MCSLSSNRLSRTIVRLNNDIEGIGKRRKRTVFCNETHSCWTPKVGVNTEGVYHSELKGCRLPLNALCEGHCEQILLPTTIPHGLKTEEAALNAVICPSVDTCRQDRALFLKTLCLPACQVFLISGWLNPVKLAVWQESSCLTTNMALIRSWSVACMGTLYYQFGNNW